MPNLLENIPWKSLCPWLLLVGSLRLAFRVRVLLLAIAAVLLVLAMVSVAERVVAGPLWEPTPIALWFSPQFASEEGWLRGIGERAAAGLLLPWKYIIGPTAAVFAGPRGFWQSATMLLLLIWQLAVWAAFGGAICRVAALALARGEAPDLPHAFRFAKRNYGAFLSAPLMTLAGVLLMSLPLVIVGLMMRAQWLAVVAALLWPIVLLIGLGLALLTVGLALGFPLMWAAVAVEETDAFDAISRALSYFYQRPLRLLGYIIVAAILGWLGGMAVELILITTRAMAEGAVAWGLGANTIVPDVEPSAAERMIHFWTGGLSVVRAAYYYGYFWSSAVGVYLLMRRDIDSVQLDEVAVEPMEPYTPSDLVARGATAETQPASNSSTRA